MVIKDGGIGEKVAHKVLEGSKVENMDEKRIYRAKVIGVRGNFRFKKID